MTTQTNTAKLAKSSPVGFGTQALHRIILISILVIMDLVAVSIAFFLAYAFRFEMGLSWTYEHSVSLWDFYESMIFLLIPIWIGIFALFGLYDIKNILSGMEEYAKTFHACTFGVMLVVLLTFLYPDLSIARGWVVLSWLLSTIAVGSGRFAVRRLVQQLRSKGYLVRRVLIVGANEEGMAIAAQLQSNRRAGVRVVGFLDNNLPAGSEPLLKIPNLGPVSTTVSLFRKYDAQEIIIASTSLPRSDLLDLFQTLDTSNIPARMSSGLYEILTTGVEVHDIGNVPLLSVNKVRLTGAEVVMKRALDLAGSMGAILVFLPLMIAIAVAVRLDSRGPIIYRRRVVGVGGKLFDAFKFRTMCVNADQLLVENSTLREKFEKNHKLKDDPRITRVGHLLRKTSLDELPQLFNVLLGQMSLVGPRMITSPERANYGKWSMNLFTVKPGMTGLWQVSGRSNVSYEERVRLDMHYIRNYSIWMDIYLLWLTIPAVLLRRGAF